MTTGTSPAEHERDPCPPESRCWALKATIRGKDADFQRIRADREKLRKVSDDLCGAALTLCTDLGIDEDAFLWQKIDAYCDYLETVGQHSLRRARQSPPASVQDSAPTGPAAQGDELYDNPKAVRPAGRVEALIRIEAAVREIEMICDEFDMDPAQWLVGGSDE